ncbi:RadC family protein [Ferruginibacter sp.]|nr:DNA repair protein RadC [Ferruginibacter sp.]
MENFNKPSTSIKNWAADDRPREKLLHKGSGALSNSELIAILINNGNKDKSAVDLAKDILKLGSDNLNELGKLTLKDFQQIKGIGEAKAITIAAALELGRRRQAAATLDKPVVQSSKDIAQYLKAVLKDFSYEVFAVLFLNRANKINHFEIISRGGITGTVADPRIILKKALEEDATSIILSHNHPSGSLKPSKADEELTQKIKEAARYFDIRVIDHIIVSEEGYYSFADEGIL